MCYVIGPCSWGWCWVSFSITLHLIFWVRVSQWAWNSLFNHTSWPANLKDPLGCLPSAGIMAMCHHTHLFFFKWRMGPGDPKSRKSRSPKLWGKHSANWCTPCPVPVALVLNHFYFLSIAWKEMLWPMRQCQSIHLKEDKNMAPGARGVTCARRWIWSPAKRKDEGREPGREEIITKCNYILPLCSCNTLPTKTDFALWNFHQIESNLKRVRCQVLQLLSTESRALKIKYSKCLLTELTRPPLLCPSTLHPHPC